SIASIAGTTAAMSSQVRISNDGMSNAAATFEKFGHDTPDAGWEPVIRPSNRFFWDSLIERYPSLLMTRILIGSRWWGMVWSSGRFRIVLPPQLMPSTSPLSRANDAPPAPGSPHPISPRFHEYPSRCGGLTFRTACVAIADVPASVTTTWSG